MDPAQQDKVASKDLFAHAQPSSDGLFAPQHLGVKDKGVAYQEFSGYEIMEREGLEDILQVIKTTYDNNAKLGPRSVSSSQPPPVKRVHAIYGINLPTKMAGVYERKDTCLSNDRLRNLCKLDSKATVDRASDYTVKGGVMFETKHTANKRSLAADASRGTGRFRIGRCNMPSRGKVRRMRYLWWSWKVQDMKRFWWMRAFTRP
jgi:hypothetical protein